MTNSATEPVDQDHDEVEAAENLTPTGVEDRRTPAVSVSDAPKNGLSAGRPADLGVRGSALWDRMTEEYELEAHEVPLLHEAARTLDLLDGLQALIAVDGPVLPWGDGVRAHPAAVEARQHRIALARLLAALTVPPGTDEVSPVQRYRRRRRSA